MSSIQVMSDSDFIYVRNKGTAAVTTDLYWNCDCGSGCEGIGVCDCPTLQPTSASSPVLTPTSTCEPSNRSGMASLAVNGEFVYRIPQRLLFPGSCRGCKQGRLTAVSSSDTMVGPHTAVVTLK
jgi:hypothetical protein